MDFPESCQQVITELRNLAPIFMVLISAAVIAVLWQYHYDSRRDRICGRCGFCQQKIHGKPPPPGSRT